MRKISIKVIVLTLVFMIVIASNNNVYATWWQKGTGFFAGGSANTSLAPVTDIKALIQTVGNMIFVAVTVILGIKYIWGGADSKASVKDSLITLVVAAIAFYSWTTIEQIFISSGKLTFLDPNSAENSAKNIYTTVLYIANFFAIGGIVYIGVKYMMAGAEGRSELKTKSVPIILGIIMVYATIEFLNIAISIV